LQKTFNCFQQDKCVKNQTCLIESPISQMDWFGDLDFNVDWNPQLSSENSTSGAATATTTASSNTGDQADIVHKRGLTLNLTNFVDTILTVMKGSQEQKKIVDYVQFIVLYCYGQRNIRKDAVNECKLTPEQREVYRRIRSELENPLKKQRILDFIGKKEITRRLINYFVVHYSVIKKEISYYLDRRTYPYKVMGELNNPNQPEIIALIEKKENIVWINFHQEYKNSKSKKGRRNRHAPYRRSTSVNGEDGIISLCEMNFYLWLDEVGGFELFYMFESDIREKKAEYDREKRLEDERKSHKLAGETSKKKKIILRNTDGRNYKTYAIQIRTQLCHTVLTANASVNDWLNEQQQQQHKRKKPDN